MKALNLLILALLILPVSALECKISEVNAVPGEDVSIPLVLKNSADEEETFYLSYSSFPSAISGYFYYEGKRVSSLTLKPNESASINFVFTAPKDIGDYQITISADESVSIMLKVEYPENALEVLPKISGLSLEAGDDATIDLTLRNKLSGIYEVSLSCIAPAGWECHFYDSGVEIFRLSLSAGESRTIKALVETNSSSEVGNYSVALKFNEKIEIIEIYVNKSHLNEKGEIRLTVIDKDGKGVSSAKITAGNESFYTSGDGTAIIELMPGTYDVKIEKGGYYEKTIRDVKVKGGRTNNLGTILLEKKAYYAEITMSSRVSATIGSVTSIPLKIKNSGYADDSYTLSVEGLPFGYTATFRENNLAVSQVFIESGSTKELILDIFVPSTAEPSELELRVLAEGMFTAEAELTLSIVGTFELTFEPESGKYTVTASQGDTVLLKGNVKNTGVGTTLTNIKISASVPSDWEILDVQPELIPSLKAGESEQVNIKISIPADASPSEYRITAIIAVSLFGLYVIVKRLGRR
ncbi:MAG: hypothetical protein PWQ22_1693 [Archaeoglobaceae archaeon]|nr:hypothetical protein [Archaeoglobaceae archaeon]